MSMFERQVLYRLNVMTTEQRAYFETTQARFQHLDDQIEGVQAQLAELYYKDQQSSFLHAFFISLKVCNDEQFVSIFWTIMVMLLVFFFPYDYMLFDESKGGEKQLTMLGEAS